MRKTSLLALISLIALLVPASRADALTTYYLAPGDARWLLCPGAAAEAHISHGNIYGGAYSKFIRDSPNCGTLSKIRVLGYTGSTYVYGPWCYITQESCKITVPGTWYQSFVGSASLVQTEVILYNGTNTASMETHFTPFR